MRVWQSTSDAEQLYISARPEGGSWQTLGTIPLDMSGLNSRGTYRYGDITVGVEIEGAAPPLPTATPTPDDSDGPAPPPDPVPERGSLTVNVEIRVWQSTTDAETLYISARPENGGWNVLGTIPLDMSGANSSGTFRYGDITLQVPVPGAVEAQPETPTPTPTPWADPRPDNTYSLQDLRELSPPADPTPPPRPDHILALQLDQVVGNPYVAVYLADGDDVEASFTHLYRSGQYPVICDGYCDYRSESEGPLNSRGTGYLSIWQAFTRQSRETRLDTFTLTAIALRETDLACEEREDTDDARLWWCWDTETYAAWEDARDRSLQPATDPLERWLRNEGGPPLWYQDSPYTGEGRHVTGVMRVDPYVTYEASRTYDGEFLNVFGLCVPMDPITGQPSIHDDRIVEGPVGDEFTLRGTSLCEWAPVSDGEWTLSITPAE